MDRHQILDAAPVIILAILLGSTILYVAGDGAFTTIGGLGDDVVCGESPLQLEGQKFTDKQELKEFLSDKELSYEKAADAWNPFVKDGQLYIQPEGDVCESN